MAYGKCKGIIEPVLAEGIGRLVEVEQWTDEHVAACIGALESETLFTWDEDDLVSALIWTDGAPTFTRYDHDTWIVSYEQGWPLDTWTTEERVHVFILGMLFGQERR